MNRYIVWLSINAFILWGVIVFQSIMLYKFTQALGNTADFIRYDRAATSRDIIQLQRATSFLLNTVKEKQDAES